MKFLTSVITFQLIKKVYYQFCRVEKFNNWNLVYESSQKTEKCNISDR